MRTLLAMMGVLCLPAGLSGCNSLDALTPPENVGDGASHSSAVTQSDLDTTAARQPVVRSTPDVVGRIPADDLPISRGTGIPQRDTRETAFADGSEDYRNPAGSLEAQASALGSNPPPQVRMQAESATGFPASGNEVRETVAAARARQPAEPAPEDTRTAAPAEEAAEEPASGEQAAAALDVSKAPAGTIRFLPIIGAPVEAVQPLSEQLGTEARAHGLTIKTAADPGSRHILKGYFSAFKDGRKTTIVYVWDVLDGAGNRLHRIQGEDSVDTKSQDLWSGVPAAAMRDIATKSIGQYLAWRDETAG